ncbi:toll/interleukin-1 receptor domain-containing protein [Vibrio vulnificus]|uniref:toll/interleukin-1 receptor domain-containing protein n=1 Tax=Vibrio vulnificus TaxID=672 RepID=UPI00307D6A87
MIFLSHNKNDKPVVEQVALKLAQVFGVNNVFYDAWSIQPGDGIIDKMSAGLQNCKYFFFFVSENSLKSQMVTLEWQNAVMRATNGQCKLIPIRMDQSTMPAIMTQTLYIDLYSVGLDAAIAQIVDVTANNNTYRAPTSQFFNVCYELNGDSSKLTVTMKAKHYLEPICNFVVLLDHNESDIICKVVKEDPHKAGFNSGFTLSDGKTYNGFLANAFRGLTPTMPLSVELETKDGSPVKVLGVLHQKSHDKWEGIPTEAQVA